MPQLPKASSPNLGHDKVVAIAATALVRLQCGRSGEALIAAMQECPYRDIEIDTGGVPMPVRGVDLCEDGCWIRNA